MSVRPEIPRPIKREVRQRCCFGCVICGIPIYHYDHVEEWSEVEERDPQNLVLLCVRHHDEKTRGFLSADEVRAKSADPFNCRPGTSSPYHLPYSGEGCEAVMGSSGLVHRWETLPDGHGTLPVIIDDTPIIGFVREDEHLLLTLQQFNEDNELVVQCAG